MIDDGDQNVDDHSSIKLDLIIPNKITTNYNYLSRLLVFFYFVTCERRSLTILILMTDHDLARVFRSV